VTARRWLVLAVPAYFLFGFGLYWLVGPDGSGDGPVAVASAPSTTTTSTTTNPTTTTTTTLPPPRTARLLFTGDLLPHGSVRNAGLLADGNGWDFAPLYQEVAPLISGADLAICHMETPISADDTGLSGYPMFNAPRAFAAAALAVGYDGCSLASNHSYDQGASGAVDTQNVFEELGLRWAGMARSVDEDLEPRLYDVNGITIAHLSATYGLNGFVLPADRGYLVDLIEPSTIIEEARIARQAGAEFVVVSLHWGNEYRHEPTAAQNDWLAQILPSDEIDLVIGHHAHVVQPVDQVGDEWVVFGLGNFLSNQSSNCCVTASQDGMIATVEILEDDDGGFSVVGVHYIPTWVDRGDGYLIRLAEPGRSDVPSGTANALAASFERTQAVVSSRLGPVDGLTIGFGLEPTVSPEAVEQ
jgi:hypothetical protein